MELQKSTDPAAEPNISHAHTNETTPSQTGREDEVQSPVTSASSISAVEKDVEKADLGTDDVSPQQKPKECTCGYQPKSDLVDFDGPDDPGNPKNWPRGKRWAITTSMGMMTFVVTFASSIFAVAIPEVSEEYNVSVVVATLGVALFLLVSPKLSFAGYASDTERALYLVLSSSARHLKRLADGYLCIWATYSSHSSRSRWRLRKMLRQS